MGSLFCATVLGLLVIVNTAAAVAADAAAEVNEDAGILDCLYEKNSLACAKSRADAELDRIEAQVAGGDAGPVTFSKVIEETGALIVDGTQSLLGQSDDEDVENAEDETDDAVSEARKHKFGKKKKKHLLKLIPLIMLFKAKISLLLQLVSTHFQLKFFAIAIVSLLVNVARFWIDLKQVHHPAKVIYYEHAQHQHHYDHDQDEHAGYWKRSAEESSPQDLAYSAYSEGH